ncbi:DUF7281 domain-containing protein [methane-oxidizing endosymbiont of Gigantopelta aegis]|uniref:DUF7281 domain-containing protein n=1 Tax=methane-oxidizing endosymbiont of Gigantopelta aegis TaxID=2794938 RepID=UPI001BE44251|nr:hypothetical protein [methane-oxidizing endosymbiont of Gigantopelta aegis]
MNALVNIIQRLLNNSGVLMKSELTARQRKALEQFAQQTRLIEISKQGRSTLYRASNVTALADYLARHQPLTEAELPVDIPNRSRNVGLHADSKKGKSTHDAYYLLMKAWDDGVIWSNGKDQLNVATMTRQFGLAALQVSTKQAWQCKKPLLLIENQALFDRCDWLENSFEGCLIYYAGQLPDILLQWLAERPRSSQLVLFPDYDGVGLSNYVRLLESIHPETKADFYWMANWQEKLQTFGDSAVWAKTHILFENACHKLQAIGAMDEKFQQLASLSQRLGKSLEQEAVWL